MDDAKNAMRNWAVSHYGTSSRILDRPLFRSSKISQNRDFKVISIQISILRARFFDRPLFHSSKISQNRDLKVLYAFVFAFID